MAGIQKGSPEWLFAMRTHYADDEDVVLLCELLEECRKEKDITKEQYDGETIEFIDDEWSS